MNPIILLIILLTFPMNSQVISSQFYWLHLCSFIIPPSHPPSVFPSADCPPSIYLIQKPTHGPPTLHQFSFTTCALNRPSHHSLGHSFLYMYTQPQLFFISLVIVKILCFHHLLSFLSSPLMTFFSRQSNPCHPWLGHPLSLSILTSFINPEYPKSMYP
jgi:hypothetical protein